MLKKYEKKIYDVITKDYDHEMPVVPMTKAFARAYRDFIKWAIKPYGLTVYKFQGNHRDASGFITDGKGHYVYISVNFDEYPATFNGYVGARDILIRHANNPSDYTGGRNQYATMESLGEDCYNIIKDNLY